ncbi:MAG: TetR/AcrR family transcriptional regulator C-terminal domain-containing protein [Thermoleophilia bacterium]|nr:TetR/AcrR family transcriptional regulator C-terminal domain-containing protein [Thermoleophilia bacterium]
MVKRAEAAAASRIPLTRERVLQTAIAFADEAGIDALSMRRLGQELGVEAMSLYNHVANKDDLLDGMAELVLGERELPARGDDWRAAVRRSAVSAHDLLRRHPWACALAMSPARNIPVRVQQMEWLLRTLREAGFSPDVTYHAYHALDSHLWGFTLWEQGHSLPAGDIADLAATFMRDFPLDDYPYVHEHVGQHVAGFGKGEKSAFEFVLDLLLDGLEQARTAAP